FMQMVIKQSCLYTHTHTHVRDTPTHPHTHGYTAPTDMGTDTKLEHPNLPSFHSAQFEQVFVVSCCSHKFHVYITACTGVDVSVCVCVCVCVFFGVCVCVCVCVCMSA